MFTVYLPLSINISVSVPSAYSLSSCLLSVPFESLSSARNISVHRYEQPKSISTA
ncbi:hypothetical protein HanXRQr2_Chr03g0122981 [Helianthus annuus]|uniref:Uncharacterized protein n=1 Tax=Helianthus annuus TaxID=4232 RepID=A0A9K3JIS8_HELAN|nr:hypothetical protein HanXRQr2_Chr03g0122981 [Helianthus annuus]KAJ0944693.1 hypothetical protein HanPSC8_Chr03g0119691 [Helianthus annuus]